MRLLFAQSVISEESKKHETKENESKITATLKWNPEEQTCPGPNDRVLTSSDVREMFCY